jgi:hypothetical protein
MNPEELEYYDNDATNCQQPARKRKRDAAEPADAEGEKEAGEKREGEKGSVDVATGGEDVGEAEDSEEWAQGSEEEEDDRSATAGDSDGDSDEDDDEDEADDSAESSEEDEESERESETDTESDNDPEKEDEAIPYEDGEENVVQSVE